MPAAAGALRLDVVENLLFDAYLRQRTRGASEVQARQNVLDAIERRGGSGERR